MKDIRTILLAATTLNQRPALMEAQISISAMKTIGDLRIDPAHWGLSLDSRTVRDVVKNNPASDKT